MEKNKRIMWTVVAVVLFLVAFPFLTLLGAEGFVVGLWGMACIAALVVALVRIWRGGRQG